MDEIGERINVPGEGLGTLWVDVIYTEKFLEATEEHLRAAGYVPMDKGTAAAMLDGWRPAEWTRYDEATGVLLRVVEGDTSAGPRYGYQVTFPNTRQARYNTKARYATPTDAMEAAEEMLTK